MSFDLKKEKRENLSLPSSYYWSGLRGSNPPPQPWQGCALPNELNPRMPPVGIEPTTRGFSIPCSTNWATEASLTKLISYKWRPWTGSNRRPLAWQASVLTNWTTGPYARRWPGTSGNNRARTCDPLLVRQMLSQLSYASISFRRSHDSFFIIAYLFSFVKNFFNFFQSFFFSNFSFSFERLFSISHLQAFVKNFFLRFSRRHLISSAWLFYHTRDEMSIPFFNFFRFFSKVLRYLRLWTYRWRRRSCM